MRKELIKTVIRPFLKKHGFTGKGVKYSKDLGVFQLHVEIQSQRYYVNEGDENFRINYNVNAEEFIADFNYNCGYVYSGFGGGEIRQASSWIEVNPSVNIEELKLWLYSELEKMMCRLEELSDPQYLLAFYEKNGILIDWRYLFLLEKFEKDNIPAFIAEVSSRIEEIESTISDLKIQLAEQQKRQDSLDKEIKTEGVKHRIKNLESEYSQISKICEVAQEYLKSEEKLNDRLERYERE